MDKNRIIQFFIRAIAFYMAVKSFLGIDRLFSKIISEYNLLADPEIYKPILTALITDIEIQKGIALSVIIILAEIVTAIALYLLSGKLARVMLKDKEQKTILMNFEDGFIRANELLTKITGAIVFIFFLQDFIRLVGEYLRNKCYKGEVFYLIEISVIFIFMCSGLFALFREKLGIFMTINKKIAFKRISLGYTDVEVSRNTDLSIYEYGDIERYKEEVYDIVNFGKIKKLFSFLELDLDILIPFKFEFFRGLGPNKIEYKMPINKLIKIKREALGLSPEQLGDKIGVYELSINDAEKKEDGIDLYNLETVLGLSEVLNIPLKILAGKNQGC